VLRAGPREPLSVLDLVGAQAQPATAAPIRTDR
jgi:hypothetical protein